jgi:hypothetical protein
MGGHGEVAWPRWQGSPGRDAEARHAAAAAAAPMLAAGGYNVF